mmetsp:Transcript_17223/g.48297  ORF Transcript_17223/g.48297 Transcript_17223/m.48297 type:complete len:343 (-) Transcript_17223:313-1341(-)
MITSTSLAGVRNARLSQVSQGNSRMDTLGARTPSFTAGLWSSSRRRRAFFRPVHQSHVAGNGDALVGRRRFGGFEAHDGAQTGEGVRLDGGRREDVPRRVLVVEPLPTERDHARGHRKSVDLRRRISNGGQLDARDELLRTAWRHVSVCAVGEHVDRSVGQMLRHVDQLELPARPGVHFEAHDVAAPTQNQTDLSIHDAGLPRSPARTQRGNTTDRALDIEDGDAREVRELRECHARDLEGVQSKAVQLAIGEAGFRIPHVGVDVGEAHARRHLEALQVDAHHVGGLVGQPGQHVGGVADVPRVFEEFVFGVKSPQVEFLERGEVPDVDPDHDPRVDAVCGP